jgi:prephenate dehydrogenase
MWRDIFVANRDAMLAELTSLRQVMDRAEHALREHDTAWLEEMLARAAQARADWPGNLK